MTLAAQPRRPHKRAPIKLSESLADAVHKLHPPPKPAAPPPSLDDMHRAVAQITQQIANVGGEVAALRNQISTNGTEFRSLLSKVEALALTRGTVEKQVVTMSQSLDALTAKVTGSMELRKALDARITELARLMEAEADIRAAKAERKAAKRDKANRKRKQKGSDSGVDSRS